MKTVEVDRDLLAAAVDLRAHVWNALVWVPTPENPKNGWPYFWNRLHQLREAMNRPEHEALRAAYALSFDPPGRGKEPRATLDEPWNIVGPDGATEGDSDD